ncbi:MAG: hypothetical protein J6X16_01435 [Bacteroidales bacterium]|nr:hypothetical protein [Bacteroidales bacterium]
MDKLTKNHLKWAVIISSALMIITWLAIPAIDVMGKVKFTMLKFITSSELNPGFFRVLIILLLLLAPIYVVMALYKDSESLQKIKGIFNYNKKILFSIPLIVMVLFILVFATQSGMGLAIGSYFYLIAAIVVCATAFVKPIDGDPED